jgi:hypothetical protein
MREPGHYWVFVDRHWTIGYLWAVAGRVVSRHYTGSLEV